jgi:hypothetical protein
MNLIMSIQLKRELLYVAVMHELFSYDLYKYRNAYNGKGKHTDACIVACCDC